MVATVLKMRKTRGKETLVWEKPGRKKKEVLHKVQKKTTNKQKTIHQQKLEKSCTAGRINEN